MSQYIPEREQRCRVTRVLLASNHRRTYLGLMPTESSRSGSGLCDEPKNLNDDVLAEAEDRPSVDSVVWRDPADRDGGGTEIVCVARGFDIDASSC